MVINKPTITVANKQPYIVLDLSHFRCYMGSGFSSYILLLHFSPSWAFSILHSMSSDLFYLFFFFSFWLVNTSLLTRLQPTLTVESHKPVTESSKKTQTPRHFLKTEAVTQPASTKGWSVQIQNYITASLYMCVSMCTFNVNTQHKSNLRYKSMLVIRSLNLAPY